MKINSKWSYGLPPVDASHCRGNPDFRDKIGGADFQGDIAEKLTRQRWSCATESIPHFSLALAKEAAFFVPALRPAQTKMAPCGAIRI